MEVDANMLSNKLRFCKTSEIITATLKDGDVVDLVECSGDKTSTSKLYFENNYSKILVIDDNAKIDKEHLTFEDALIMSLMGDWKIRFIGEYYQTLIRYFRLKKTIKLQEKGNLPYKPQSSLESLKYQAKQMGKYMHSLETRAKEEGIELNYKAIID